MKVYLDDERSTPDGWVRVYWPEEAIELLKAGGVTEISLDHDLGDFLFHLKLKGLSHDWREDYRDS